MESVSEGHRLANQNRGYINRPLYSGREPMNNGISLSHKSRTGIQEPQGRTWSREYFAVVEVEAQHQEYLGGYR